MQPKEDQTEKLQIVREQPQDGPHRAIDIARMTQIWDLHHQKGHAAQGKANGDGAERVALVRRDKDEATRHHSNVEQQNRNKHNRDDCPWIPISAGKHLYSKVCKIQKREIELTLKNSAAVAY